MSTVFSHIVQKRFSQEYENIATDALAFILESSESARCGLMKLLRGIEPGLPSLLFRTQQTEGSTRPDMCGLDGPKERVFIENKFWAGLTENQPVGYLERLAKHTQPSVLLVVSPDARLETLWRESCRRLGISIESKGATGTTKHIVKTTHGPVFTLTSWKNLLSVLEHEVAGDQDAMSNLRQLQSLCDAADTEAFLPISSEEASDQRIPALILELSSVLKASVSLAVNEGVMYLGRLMPQADSTRIGRYAYIGDGKHPGGVWLGIHFGLWKKHGGTPVWALFYNHWEFADEVRALLEPWAIKRGVFANREDEFFAMAIDIACHEDKDQVVRGIVDRLKEMAGVLSVLPPKKPKIE